MIIPIVQSITAVTSPQDEEEFRDRDVLSKKGECRNMSAKPEVRRSPQQRTSQFHQTGIRTLETFKLTYELCFYPLKFLSHYVIIRLCLGQVVDTYPPSIHTCSPCRRYVVVTYRPIIFNSCREHVSDTCNSGELILIGTE